MKYLRCIAYKLLVKLTSIFELGTRLRTKISMHELPFQVERGRCQNSGLGRTVSRLQQRVKVHWLQRSQSLLNTQGQLNAQCHTEGYYGIEKLFIHSFDIFYCYYCFGISLILYDVPFQTFKTYLKLLSSIMRNTLFQIATGWGYLNMCIQNCKMSSTF